MVLEGAVGGSWEDIDIRVGESLQNFRETARGASWHLRTLQEGLQGKVKY